MESDSILDFSGVLTKADLYALLKKELGLPEYFGENLDALYDCLTDLNPESVTILNFEQLPVSLTEYGEQMLRVFEAAGVSVWQE